VPTDVALAVVVVGMTFRLPAGDDVKQSRQADSYAAKALDATVEQTN